MSKRLRYNLKFRRELGEAIIRFQNLELIMSGFIWHLLGLPKSEVNVVGKIITSQLSFSRLIDLLNSLFIYRMIDERSEIRKLKVILGKISHIESKRNIYFHSLYALNEEGYHLRFKTKVTRKGFASSIDFINKNEMTIFLDELGKVTRELTTLYTKTLKTLEGTLLTRYGFGTN